MHKADTNMEQPNGGLYSGTQDGQKTNPSVRLGSLTGEILGAVPMETTMAKPKAYKATRNTNLGNT